MLSLRPLAWVMERLGFHLPSRESGATMGSRRALHEAISRLSAPAALALIEIRDLSPIALRFGEETAEQVRHFVFSRLLQRLRGRLFRVNTDQVAGLFLGMSQQDLDSALAEVAELVESYPFRVRAIDRPKRDDGRQASARRGNEFKGPELSVRLAAVSFEIMPGEAPGTVLNRARRVLAEETAVEGVEASSS
ncbi:MAG: hypothetical protein D6807_06345 [Alphaproteobacteria bacterium]|nr:MAG: hypothetical protein D6807_06345 [Alphaproteobacteria bacterium]